jgi:tetratricopeptide (TPR) repeat protein
VGSLADRSSWPDAPIQEPESWLEAVKHEERRGELLAAFDLAERGLAQHPDDVSLKHRAVLALARAGATEEAARRFRAYGLGDVQEEETAALRARIAKDFALSEEGTERRRRAARAAELYGAVFARTGGYYPAINSATLWLIAGDRQQSRELAEVALSIVSANGEDSYWKAATEAEAQLLLGRDVAAYAALERASVRHGQDYAALATTRRQLRVICETLGVDPAVLSPLTGPGVVYYCGHRSVVGGEQERFPPDAEARVGAAIAHVLAHHEPGYAYGALAGGGDILWAEALLARGAELLVVLPFRAREFIEVSVAPSGRGWVERFQRCLNAATEVRYATDDEYLGDDVLIRYGGELAMGLALLRARYLDAEARQLALWDGQRARGGAGTAVDVGTWRSAGRPVTIVTPGGEVSIGEDQIPSDGHASTVRRSGADEAAMVGSGRVVRAMLYGDFKWFSKLTDQQAVTFATKVLGVVADVARRHHDRVLFRNTWGDGLTLVLTDAVAAAALALDLQDTIAEIDLESEQLPTHLGLRLGGHVGPVCPVYDPVLEAERFTGSHVSRTARIEPVTPPGAVYVTEAFAAGLVLAGEHELACDYVGHMAAAKGYGKLRMYRLRRLHSGDDPLP